MACQSLFDRMGASSNSSPGLLSVVRSESETVVVLREDVGRSPRAAWPEMFTIKRDRWTASLPQG